MAPRHAALHAALSRSKSRRVRRAAADFCRDLGASRQRLARRHGGNLACHPHARGRWLMNCRRSELFPGDLLAALHNRAARANLFPLRYATGASPANSAKTQFFLPVGLDQIWRRFRRLRPRRPAATRDRRARPTANLLQTHKQASDGPAQPVHEGQRPIL